MVLFLAPLVGFAIGVAWSSWCRTRDDDRLWRLLAPCIRNHEPPTTVELKAG